MAIYDSGLSQAKLAEAVGVSQNTISNWKRGTYLPRHQHLTSLAEHLGVSVSSLTGEDDLAPQPSNQPELSATDDETEMARRLADLDLLGALEVLRDAQPQLQQLAEAIPDLIQVLATAEDRGANRPPA